MVAVRACSSHPSCSGQHQHAQQQHTPQQHCERKQASRDQHACMQLGRVGRTLLQQHVGITCKDGHAHTRYGRRAAKAGEARHAAGGLGGHQPGGLQLLHGLLHLHHGLDVGRVHAAAHHLRIAQRLPAREAARHPRMTLSINNSLSLTTAVSDTL